LRIALITKAEHVEKGPISGAKIGRRIGGDCETRTVFSGIKSAYKTEDLEGKKYTSGGHPCAT